ncbi:glycosyltransferase [Candidatus Saccharibacteria bacterium]|nr:glycosyltransferase [Candidatus Saccharibacteria bacterium]MBR6122953.1 glycosyltransferase [Candidatus Saccharibacteria bacterium]
MQRISNFSKNFYRGAKSLWKQYHFFIPPKVFFSKAKYLIGTLIGLSPLVDPMSKSGYRNWYKNNEKTLTEHEQLQYRPLISVLIPVYNVKAEYLTQCIESILQQSYDNFELCLVDDASTLQETKDVLKSYEANPKVKIKHRQINSHISRATNDALAIASGDFIALADNDDTLAKDALYEVAKALNDDKKLDLIYSDEDKLDENGRRCYPHFKPDFSPDTLLGLNYICHLVIVRTKLLREIGGFTVGLEGAQDYDMLLRFTEKTNHIYHIPKILYHWRMLEGSTAQKLDNKDYASDKGKLAIEAALKRRKLDATVEKDPRSTYYRVIYDVKKEPLVSIIIPTKDYADITETCLKSIYEKTTYKNFEILLVNNRSEKPETFQLLEKYQKAHQNFRVIDADMDFNYSKINNLAVKQAKGTVLVLLNNDTEIITPDWLKLMVGYAVQPHVGAVGAKLLYPDNTIQHGGVVLGLGGVAGHTYLGETREALGLYGRLCVPYDYGAVTAACLCVEKKKFEEVKGLEEKGLKVAFNDIDFNMKLLDKGYYNVMLPMVELYHYESKSRGMDTSPEKQERFKTEIEFMQHKWGNKLTHDRFYNPNYSLKGAFVLDRKKEADE